MGAKQITPMSEVDAYLEEQIQRIEQQTIYNLSYVGERCLNEARSTNSYKDQTGNLRSSIGYVIVKDGTILLPSKMDERERKAGRHLPANSSKSSRPALS